MNREIIKSSSLLLMILIISFSVVNKVKAASAMEIDASVDTALNNLYTEVMGSEKLVESAKGVLVFPNVYKAGFILGAEYGEGALRIHDTTVGYYSTTSGSLGWQLGAQKKSIIMLFMEDYALDKFLKSSNWKAGVDASVALIAVGADGSIDTAKTNQPIVAFVIGQKGLMYNLTLEGTKINKLNK